MLFDAPRDGTRSAGFPAGLGSGGAFVRCLSAFASGFARQFMISREAPHRRPHAKAAFATGSRRQFMIAGETALLLGNAGAALPGDSALLFRIHGCKSASGLAYGWVRLVVVHCKRLSVAASAERWIVLVAYGNQPR